MLRRVIHDHRAGSRCRSGARWVVDFAVYLVDAIFGVRVIQTCGQAQGDHALTRYDGAAQHDKTRGESVVCTTGCRFFAWRTWHGGHVVSGGLRQQGVEVDGIVARKFSEVTPVIVRCCGTICRCCRLVGEFKVQSAHHRVVKLAEEREQRGQQRTNVNVFTGDSHLTDDATHFGQFHFAAHGPQNASTRVAKYHERIFDGLIAHFKCQA